MPEYVIQVEEAYDQAIEEICRAWRTLIIRKHVIVEADSEEEALELAAQDCGECIDEDFDYGDVYDSETWDYGDVLEENYVESNYENVTEEHRRREEQRRRTYEMYIKPYTKAIEPNWSI